MDIGAISPKRKCYTAHIRNGTWKVKQRPQFDRIDLIITGKVGNGMEKEYQIGISSDETNELFLALQSILPI